MGVKRLLAEIERLPVSDSPRYKTLWLCEQWSEDAVQFCMKKLDRMGITEIPRTYGHGQLVPVPVSLGEIPSWLLRSLVRPAEKEIEILGNLLLNEGIQRLEDLTMIATVTSNQVAGNPWSNGNAYLGVGDSSTAEAATQTELQAATNRFYKAMNATYPSRSSQTVTFQSDFTSTEANYAWAEWSVAAGATTASGSGFTTGTTNLNRKVASLGTKSTGTWTLSATVTFSYWLRTGPLLEHRLGPLRVFKPWSTLTWIRLFSFSVKLADRMLRLLDRKTTTFSGTLGVAHMGLL